MNVRSLAPLRSGPLHKGPIERRVRAFFVPVLLTKLPAAFRRNAVLSDCSTQKRALVKIIGE